jgi:hypothetical protein
VTLNISQVTDYRMSFFDDWNSDFSQDMNSHAKFDSSSLVVGQRILIGGTVDSTGKTLVPQSISLRRQGVMGEVVSGSVVVGDHKRGSFQLQNNGLLGYILGAPLTVETGEQTKFVSLGNLDALLAKGTIIVVARGLVLKDPTSGNPQLWAVQVREIKNSQSGNSGN